MDTNNQNNDDVTIEPELDMERGGKDPTETISKLKEELKKITEEKQKYLDSWQRDKAEFLNARKRDKEINAETLKFANENLVGELLPVLESFNHAFGNKEAWEKVDKNWRVGVEYIANQLKSVLEGAGLKEINPLGQKFDPMRDEAIAHEPVTDEKMDHVITAVVSKGYEFNGKQMTAPKVKVGEFKK
jgi:molecular chaperone GrpE